MGLLLGGSVLTVFELMDLIIFNFVKKMFPKRSLLQQLPRPDLSFPKRGASSNEKLNEVNGPASEKPDPNKWSGIEWIDENKVAEDKY